jgi:hypothetical protein
MALSQQSNPLNESQIEEGEDVFFDADMRADSSYALFSLLTHLKRQDEESIPD